MIMHYLAHNFAAACSGGNFLGFPKWYKYLPGHVDPNTGVCTPQLTSLNDVWLIVAAILELLLRVAALAAVIMILYGGTQFVMTRGEPDKATQARHTLMNAIVGLVIAVIAATTVSFIAGRVS